MSSRTSPTLHRLTVALATGCLGLATLAQPAFGAEHAILRGRASAAAGAATVSADVQRATGHGASQLNARPVCSPLAVSRIHCYARILTLKSTGAAVTPLHFPHASRTPGDGAASSAPATYTAAFLQSAYDTAWLSANRGAADTVAIVDAYGDPSAYIDMEQFRSANGLPSLPTCASLSATECFERVNQNRQTTNLPSPAGGWNVEESLDIDAVSSICPLCKIVMVEANSDDSSGHPDLETAVSAAAALGANQISLSWGADVAPDAAGWESPYSSISSAAILAAAGDSSYPGPKVGYPAALPSVTAVGGTALTPDAAAPRGYGESAWSLETCSGGSTCATESGCDTSQAVPPYQSATTTGCNGRAYNDISADGDPSTGLEIYDSQPGSEGCGTSNHWCIVGGTSLATPLTAALEGVTGVSAADTPAWIYTSASLLNDVISGSDGTCPSGWSLICNATGGWDGPTGNGSISGDLVPGGPGIGAQPSATAIGATAANVSGQVNPNDSSPSADTSAYWQYGPTTGYSSTTPPVSLSAGASFEGVAASLGLSQPCVYHYRLVATNAIGTVYGYDHTVTPTQPTTAPANTSPPSVTGTLAVGQQLTVQPGTWSGVDCDTTYQWQEAASPSASSWTSIGGATSTTYTPAPSDAGKSLQVAVTETNAAGRQTVTSAPTAQVPAPPVTTTTTPTTTTPTPTTTTPTPTTTPTTSSSTTTAATTTTQPTATTTTQPTATTTQPTAPTTPSTSITIVRFYRCAQTCRLLNLHGARVYRPRPSDYGRYIKIVRTVTHTVGGVTSRTAGDRWVGPITASTAGDINIGSGAHLAATTVVRGSTGGALAQVRITQRHGSRLTLAVQRVGTAPTKVWAYVVARGRIVFCTRTVSVGRPGTLSFALKRGQTIRLVAVRA